MNERKDVEMNKEQYKGLNKVLMKINEDRKFELRILYGILVLSILVNVVIASIFISYEKSMVYETTWETTTTQEVEGDEAEINNVEGNMYKDNSVHNDSLAE